MNTVFQYNSTMKAQYEFEVRYSECDQGGVVHHAVYPIWFEEARKDFFEKAGMPFSELDARGILPPLVDLHVQYRSPVRYPGHIMIETFVSDYSPKKIELTYHLYYEKKLVSEATTLIVWTTKNEVKTLNMQETYPDLYDIITTVSE